MKITIYKTATGKITKMLNGPDNIINCLDADESYIEGEYDLTGSVVNGVYTAKTHLFPDYPVETLRDVVGYAPQGKDAITKALRNTGVSNQDIDDALIQHYEILRSKSYPSFLDYLDAQAKKASTDADIVAEGQAQESAYIEACLAVKKLFPKNKQQGCR